MNARMGLYTLQQGEQLCKTPMHITNGIGGLPLWCAGRGDSDIGRFLGLFRLFGRLDFF